MYIHISFLALLHLLLSARFVFGVRRGRLLSFAFGSVFFLLVVLLILLVL